MTDHASKAAADVSRHCPECERLAARVERLEAALREIRGLIAGGMDNFEKWKEANEVIDAAESGKKSEGADANHA